MIVVKNNYTVRQTYLKWLEQFISINHPLNPLLNEIISKKKIMSEDEKMDLQKRIEEASFNTSESFTNLSYTLLDTTKKIGLERRLLFIKLLKKEISENKNLFEVIGLGTTAEKLHSIFMLGLINTTNRSINKIDLTGSKELIKIRFTYNNLFITIINILTQNIYTCGILKESADEFDLLNQEKYDEKQDIEKVRLKYLLQTMTLSLIQIGETSRYITIDKEYLQRPGKERNYQVKYIYLNSDIKDSILCLIDVSLFKLPMLIPPVSYKKNSRNIWAGGYLLSANDQSAKFNIVIGLSDHLSIKIKKDEFMNAINYIQKTPIKLDSEYLDKLLDLNNYDILESSKKVIDLDTIWDEVNIDEKDYDKIKRLTASSFLLELHIAISLSDMPLYLPWNIDNRGRYYNVTYPVCFYTRKELRPAFSLYNSCELESLLSDEKINDLNKWELIHYNIHKSQSLIGIDATASVYQIIGGIIKNDKMMKYTNVVINNDEESISKYDIYQLITDKCKELLDYSKIKLHYAKNYEIISKQYTNKPERILNPEEFMDMITNMGRSFYKRFFMTFAYNQSLSGLIEEIAKALNVQLYEKAGKKDRRDDMYMCIYSIAKKVRKAISTLFPEINKFRTICMKVAKYNSKNNKYIKISTKDGYHNIYQSYKKQYTSVIRVWSSTKKESLSIYKKITGDDCADMIKNSIALSPNLVHYLDSTIMIYVVLKCRKNNIPILPIHDCFYTNIAYLDKVKTYYKEGYCKYIIDNNNLLDLIDNNIKKSDQDIRDQLINYLNEIRDINRTVNKSEIFKSKYILC